MRGRVIAAIVGSVGVTLVLFALPLAWLLGERYEDDLRFRLQGAAAAAAPALIERTGDTAPLPPTLTLTRRRIGIAYYDARGRWLSGDGPRPADEIVRVALASGSGVGDTAIAERVEAEGRLVGVVRAEETRGRLGQRIRKAWVLMALLALLVLASVSTLAFVLARRLAAPVRALAEAAQRLEAGDFAVAPAASGIGELDAAGVALTAAARRLENVLARERALTADVAHQLRTPLTALRLEIEAGAARRQGPDLARLVTEVERIEATIASILALARDTAAPRQPIAIARVITAAGGEWVPRARRAGRELVIDCAAVGGDTLRISAPALRQIVDVLIDNALTHGRGRIAVVVRHVAGGIEVRVNDEGVAPAAGEAVFARRSPSAHGHGIGLALARSLAEAEGGRLSLLADEPTTTFSLLFVESDDADG